MSTQGARYAALVLITAGCSVARVCEYPTQVIPHTSYLIHGYQSEDSIRGIFSVVLYLYLPVGCNPVILTEYRVLNTTAKDVDTRHHPVLPSYLRDHFV
jgi:hypothetical protein